MLRYFGPHNTTKVDIYRPTEIGDEAGGTTKSWTRVAKNIAVVLQHLTGGQAEKLFGVDTVAKWRALTEETHDIAIGDVLKVKTGESEGVTLGVDNVIKSWGRMKNVVLRDTDVVISG